MQSTENSNETKNDKAVEEKEIDKLGDSVNFEKINGEIEKECTDDFLRKVQTINRNKNPYLKLVNAAIYGKFDCKFYENQTTYNKAAEYFALFGCSDLLDSTVEFSINNNKKYNEMKNEKSNASIKEYRNMENSLNHTSDQAHHNEKSFPGNTSYSIQPIATQPNAGFPKALNLISPQQILIQLNQPSNMILNYPTTSLVQYYSTPIWSTKSMPYVNTSVSAYLNESPITHQQHINTSIVQQQQQYNFYSGGIPYGMQYLGFYYAQLLQKSQQISQNIALNNNLFGQYQTKTVPTINPATQYELINPKQMK